MHLIVLAVVLPTLAKLVVILKLGLRNISQRITSLIILNIYTLQANSKLELKLTKRYILTGQNLV